MNEKNGLSVICSWWIKFLSFFNFGKDIKYNLSMEYLYNYIYAQVEGTKKELKFI